MQWKSFLNAGHFFNSNLSIDEQPSEGLYDSITGNKRGNYIQIFLEKLLIKASLMPLNVVLVKKIKVFELNNDNWYKSKNFK